MMVGSAESIYIFLFFYRQMMVGSAESVGRLTIPLVHYLSLFHLSLISHLVKMVSFNNLFQSVK
jgi:hypothetical protein